MKLPRCSRKGELCTKCGLAYTHHKSGTCKMCRAVECDFCGELWTPLEKKEVNICEYCRNKSKGERKGALLQ